MPSFLQQPKSANPFDLSEPVQAQHVCDFTSFHFKIQYVHILWSYLIELLCCKNDAIMWKTMFSLNAYMKLCFFWPQFYQ